jgi:hypothetical protein
MKRILHRLDDLIVDDPIFGRFSSKRDATMDTKGVLHKGIYAETAQRFTGKSMYVDLPEVDRLIKDMSNKGQTYCWYQLPFTNVLLNEMKKQLSRWAKKYKHKILLYENRKGYFYLFVYWGVKKSIINPGYVEPLSAKSNATIPRAHHCFQAMKALTIKEFEKVLKSNRRVVEMAIGSIIEARNKRFNIERDTKNSLTIIN